MPANTNEYRGYYYSAPDDDIENLYYAMHVYTHSMSDAKLIGRTLAKKLQYGPVVVKKEEL